MALSFAIPDAEVDNRIAVTVGKDADNVARVRVAVVASAGPGRELTLADVDTLDACVADGTLTAAERTTLGQLVRKLALRSRTRMGVQP
jgi:hypothetical protein